MSCDNGCQNDCTKANVVTIDLEGAPEEVVSLVNAVAKIAVDYPLAVSGVKKRTTEARKSLMEVKKLSLEMRKMALEKCKVAKENV